jgi:ubiquinone biosynthesis protein COQ9
MCATRIPRLLVRPIRLFHSFQQPAEPVFTDTQSAILSHALKRAPSEGFTYECLMRGHMDSGYPSISHTMFPNGPWTIAYYHLVSQRNKLSDAVEGMIKGKSIPDALRILCRERLLQNAEIIHRWPEALKLLAEPANLAQGLEELALLADELLYVAGDRSVEADWYTKRAAISAVYSSSELFMTTDTSLGFKHSLGKDYESCLVFSNSLEFLDARLTEVFLLGSISTDVSEYVSFGMRSAVNIMRSRGIFM